MSVPRVDYRTIADSRFELQARMVYLWCIPTVAGAGVLSWLEGLLSPDEKERAARFRFEHLRHSFVIARGVLRVLLGGYLGISPASVQFVYNLKGKPTLPAPAFLEFNASHAGGLAVFAFTTACEVGVDVEQIRPLTDMQDIANRFFCPGEAAELLSLNESQREHAFFLCWTRKEAYIKAIGEGLSAPLDSFRVNIEPGAPARFVELPLDAGAWTLHDLQLASDYAAALAYHDTERPVAILRLNDPAELRRLSVL